MQIAKIRNFQSLPRGQSFPWVRGHQGCLRCPALGSHPSLSPSPETLRNEGNLSSEIQHAIVLPGHSDI